MSSIALLGPQKTRANLQAAVTATPGARTWAVITAGWEDREAETDELSATLGFEPVPLALHERAELLLDECPELLERSQEYQRLRRGLRELYNLRLSHAIHAVQELLVHPLDERLLEPEVADAVESVRRLDAYHVGRAMELWEQLGDGWSEDLHERHERQVREVRELVDPVDGVLIAGGHVGRLLRCLRLFRVEEAMRGKSIVAWSGGAMVLCPRVVLFHDFPPQGPGNAEVFEEGLGLVPDVVALPHFRRRLDLDSGPNLSLLARRIAPDRCLGFEDGSSLRRDGDREERVDVVRLTEAGEIEAA